MTNFKVDECGTKRWYNEKGQLHRDGDKPAVEDINGYKAWYQNGKRHRDGDKPTVERANCDKQWYKQEKFVDIYYANFGCFKPKTREEALERLNAKKRPYSRELYMNDINKMFPEKTK